MVGGYGTGDASGIRSLDIAPLTGALADAHLPSDLAYATAAILRLADQEDSRRIEVPRSGTSIAQDKLDDS